MNKVLYIFLSLFMCLPFYEGRAHNDYPFIHINSSNSGLSYDDCRAIFQDSRGFMWFGTYKGLNRYDGKRFTVYDRDDLCGVSDFIHAIAEDGDGNLWIGTDNGLLVYDYEADIFRVFDKISDKGTAIHNKVSYIQKDSRETIWIAVNGQGLFSYDVASESLKNFFFEDGRQTLCANIRTLEPDHHGGLWIALYYAGLYHSDASMTSLVPVENYKGIRLESDNIEGIVVSPTENDVLYFSSVKNGLCQLNVRTGQIQRLIPVSDDSLPNGLVCHRGVTLWMSTTNGLYRYDILSGTYSLIKSDTSDVFSISHNYVFDVYLDRYDGLWVSTKYNGINYCSTAQKWFKKHYMINGRPLDDYVISGLVSDVKGNILITTESGRFLKYDQSTGKLSEFGPSSIKGIDLISPCIDGDYLWLGSMRGLYRYDMKSGSLRLYDALSRKADLPDDRVGTVYLADNGTLYIGTTLGLSYYNRQTDSFESISDFDGINVTSLSEDSFGKIWISTYANGIYCYDSSKGKILRHFSSSQTGNNKIPTDKISSIYVDSKDRVWAVGLTYGFSVYESGLGRFKSYDSKTCSGMCTDVCFNAIEDNNGNIWISSDKGLLEVNPQTMDMAWYTVRDGLLDDVLKRGVLKTQDGDLYFASQSGFVRFNPSEFRLDANYKIIISGFTVADSLVKPSDEDSPLSKNVDLVDKISLKPGQNSFGFTFSLMNGTGPKARIQCMLEGYEKAWSDISSDQEAYFYNVPAGKYKLKVRYSSDGKSWFAGHNDVNVEVAEEFWKSDAAIAVYVLLSCLIIGLIARQLNERSKKKLQQQEEKSRIEREKAFLKEKMEFFSEVIHEIKTPLTLMITPLRTIMESEDALDENLKKNLNIINSSTEYMGTLVRELLDFMSVEEHGYVLDLRNMDIVANLKSTCNNFAEIAKERGLQIDVDSQSESVIVAADRKALVKIFNNLIHNAVKYAESWINVCVAEEQDSVVIRFANDGPQIPADRRADIFKPFVKFTAGNQYAAQSFGIGLSMARKLVEIHGGTLELTDNSEFTEFVVTIPLNMREEEMENEREPFAADSKLPSLLLVEDSLELSQYLSHELTAQYNVLHAFSAEKGLKLLQARSVDLILTDVGLPGMSGVEFCAELQSNRTLSHIPVIVLSAMSSADIKTRCIENGAAMYIEKPFSMSYLKACIGRVVKAGKKSDDVILDSAAALQTLRKMNIMDRDAEFIEKLDEVILENLTDDTFGSKQMEEALFMSRSTLARKIREIYDMTPNDYLKHKRLSVATQMLMNKNVRINEVARAVGFRSASYFTKCFKAEYGVLPAEYISEKNK